MKKFIESLPVKNMSTKEKVEIAFYHFMAGEKMYFPEPNQDQEITTQFGFYNAVMNNPELKLTRTQVDEIIADYNKKNINPEKYRELQIQLREYHTQDFSNRQIQQSSNLKKKHPVKYIIAKLQKKI